MLESVVKNVSEVIFRLSISDGMNICELSQVSEIPVDIVRHILRNMLNVPLGGITLEYYETSPNDDVFKLSTDILDKKVIWKVILNSNSQIPVENLDEEELLILKRIIKDVEDNDWNNIWCDYPNNTAVFVQGTSSETDEIFKCRHYLNIRSALVKKQKIHIRYKNEEYKNIECEAIPVGMVFHSEKQDWFLVICTEDNKITTINIEKTISIVVLDNDGCLKDFDLKEYLRHCFDIESTEKYSVEVLFENKCHIIEHAKRRLSGIGTFAETEGEYVKFSGVLTGIDEFKRWILGFGDSVKVVKPQWLADEQFKEWNDLLNSYDKLDEFLEKNSKN